MSDNPKGEMGTEILGAGVPNGSPRSQIWIIPIITCWLCVYVSCIMIREYGNREKLKDINRLFECFSGTLASVYLDVDMLDRARTLEGEGRCRNCRRFVDSVVVARDRGVLVVFNVSVRALDL